jgi:glucosamine--fructose-6-phosphate aminotransferase (isomerizing)
VIEGIVPREIREGPAAIRSTLDTATGPAADVAARLVADGVRRVFVIGNGTSLHSALASTLLYRRHAGPDDPAVVALTAGEFRTYRPELGPGDAVVGISSSGEFRDVIGAFEELPATVPTVGIVHVPDSTLTRVARHIVLSAGGPSQVPVMTKTFSSTLVATELVLLGLLGPRGAPVVDAIRAAADHAEAVLGVAAPLVEELADRLAGFEHWFVVGAGGAHVASLEAALKLKEMALVHAEGAETWEMASGAATILGPTSVVVALAPNGAGRSATANAVGHAAEWGSTIVEVGPDRLVPASTLLELPAAAEEDHAPLTAVPPVALLGFALARRRGANPDQPGWIERYHSQGLRHILGAETGEEAAS